MMTTQEIQRMQALDVSSGDWQYIPPTDFAPPMVITSDGPCEIGDSPADLELMAAAKFGHKPETFSESPNACARMAAVLETVLIGEPSERQRMVAVFSAISDEGERRKAMDIFFDQKRTSMNNIGSRAIKMAKQLRDKSAARAAQEQK